MQKQQKLELIVDVLLVKTLGDLCNWKKKPDGNFILTLSMGKITIYKQENDVIVLDVYSHQNPDVIVAFLCVEERELNSSLVRLFKAVTRYFENYVNEHIEKILSELEKMSNDKPF
jgi:hypothetical protein